jgi:predicted transcriptional regulator
MNEYETTVLELIGKGIQATMHERKIGINKLTELTGLSKNSIYKVLRGENYEINVLIKIMRQLQLHIELSLLEWGNNIYTF